MNYQGSHRSQGIFPPIQWHRKIRWVADRYVKNMLQKCPDSQMYKYALFLTLYTCSEWKVVTSVCESWLDCDCIVIRRWPLYSAIVMMILILGSHCIIIRWWPLPSWWWRWRWWSSWQWWIIIGFFYIDPGRSIVASFRFRWWYFDDYDRARRLVRDCIMIGPPLPLWWE